MNAIITPQSLQPSRPVVVTPLRTVIRPQQNLLLAALPEDVQCRLFPHLELYPLAQGTVLDEPGVSIHHVYFPTDALISQQCMTENGACTEISMVGNDGLVGINLFMGKGGAPGLSVVQCAGHAFRLDGLLIKEEFRLHGELLRLVLRYMQALIAQMAQISACNRHHTVDQQLCRWLLQSLDRLPGDRLKMTQEQIANTLGVRRQSVTGAAWKLQQQGVIRYSRGHITVLDRAGLQKQSCECYRVMKRETDKLLPSTCSAQPTPWRVSTSQRH